MKSKIDRRPATIAGVEAGVGILAAALCLIAGVSVALLQSSVIAGLASASALFVGIIVTTGLLPASATE
jgi:hypothetical protein